MEIFFAPGSSAAGSKGNLIVVNSEKGQIVKVPILPEGSAGDPEILVSDPTLVGVDGITLDNKGNLYGTVNTGNSIVRVSSNGSSVQQIATGAPLDFSTSLASGTGKDRHSLFVSNFSVIRFLNPSPRPEGAHPGIISLCLK